MISSVTDQDDLDDEVSHDRDSPVHHDRALQLRQGYDFSEVRKETQNTYQFGHRPTNQITIDASLSRLFECMSLAYRGGKVVSPKWKNFKGMRLSVKDKIRLNNAIWRTWHIQYIMHRRRSKISFVQFATPLDTESDCDSHSKPEAVVMEGKYWKRRIETVVAEYKKWRAFFMEKLRESDHPGLTWVSTHSPATPESFNMLDPTFRSDDYLKDQFTDRLLSCLSQPFQFPNPREIAQHATNSDMMQPGLLQLQPMIEDFIDPLDTLHDIFSPNRKSSLNNSNNISLFYAGPNFQSSPQSDYKWNDQNSGMIMQQDMNTTGLQETTSLEELVQRATAEHDPNSMCVTQPEMEMHHMQTMRHQEGPPQQMQQTNMNFGVSDPMLNPINEKMFNPHRIGLSNNPPMMISKQQQQTPTISQIVTAHTHHHHNTTYDQNKVQTIMPPPQKKPPRKKSTQQRTYTDAGSGHGMYNSSNVLHMTQPQVLSTMPQTISHTGDALNFSMSQMSPAPMRMEPSRGQMNTTPTSALQQVIISTNMGNYTISTPAALVPVEKLIYTQSLTSMRVQTTNRDMIIDSMNANNNLPPNNSPRRKENVPQSVPMMEVPSQHMNTTNQGNFEQIVGKQIIIKGNSAPDGQIQMKQQVQINSQPSSLLTQLLQTSFRPSDQTKSSSSLQAPSNSTVVFPAKEAQFRKVKEQAANFNTFQNSVVMAAAQLAVAPKTQHDMGVTSSQPVALVQQHAMVPPNTNSNTNARSQATTVSKLSQANVAQKPFLKNQTDTMGPAWPLVSATTVSVMDIDEDTVSENKSYGSSVGEQTQKSSMFSIATSPSTSSSPNSASSEHRSSHFTAEQIRRCNMKSFFKTLQDMIPDTSTHPNSKVSKAVVLSKTCNYIKTLQSTRHQVNSEIQKLKREIKELNEDISNFQQQLPVTGAPVCRKHGDRMGQFFNEWVRERTLHNWKFFIFSMIIRPWFITYDESVSIASLDELCKTCLMWLEKCCSLPCLRRSVVHSLQELSTTTSILSDPTTLQQQAENVVQQSSRRSSNSSS